MEFYGRQSYVPGPGVSVRPLRLFGDPVLRTACDPTCAASSTSTTSPVPSAGGSCVTSPRQV